MISLTYRSTIASLAFQRLSNLLFSSSSSSPLFYFSNHSISFFQIQSASLSFKGFLYFINILSINTLTINQARQPMIFRQLMAIFFLYDCFVSSLISPIALIIQMIKSINVARTNEPSWATISLTDDLMPRLASSLVQWRIFLSEIQRALVSTMERKIHEKFEELVSGPGFIS